MDTINSAGDTGLLGHTMNRIEAAEGRIKWQAQQIAAMRDMLAMAGRRLEKLENASTQHDRLFNIIRDTPRLPETPRVNESHPYLRLVSDR